MDVDDAIEPVMYAKLLLPFARAAAAHACSDDADEWNALIEAWDALPVALQLGLLKPEA